MAHCRCPAYQLHMRQVRDPFEVTLDARVSERTRIVPDPQDTLSQTFPWSASSISDRFPKRGTLTSRSDMGMSSFACVGWMKERVWRPQFGSGKSQRYTLACPGMPERAKLIRGDPVIWSEIHVGTEEPRIPPIQPTPRLKNVLGWQNSSSESKQIPYWEKAP